MIVTFQSPVDARLAEPFGWQRRARLRRFSRGVTYQVPYGAPVRASQSGRVIETSAGGLAIEHAPGLVTYYARLGFVAVQRGQAVKAGDIVGRAGNLPGLFFAIWLGDKFINPHDAFLLGVNSFARGMVAGGHRPSGEVNWQTLRGEVLTYVVLGLLMWATAK